MKEGKRYSVTGKLIKGIDLMVSANTEVSLETTSKSDIIAVMSNPKMLTVRKDGKPCKVKQRSHTYCYAPLLWPMINEAARNTGIKAQQLQKYLDCWYCSLGYFKTLAGGTVQHWIEKGKWYWKKSGLEQIREELCWSSGMGHKPFFQDHPSLKDHIKAALLGMQQVCLVINASIAQNAIIGMITIQPPDLLAVAEGPSRPILPL
jgi:Zn-finger protein